VFLKKPEIDPMVEKGGEGKGHGLSTAQGKDKRKLRAKLTGGRRKERRERQRILRVNARGGRFKKANHRGVKYRRVEGKAQWKKLKKEERTQKRITSSGRNGR